MPELIGYEYEMVETIQISESQLADFMDEETVIDYRLVTDYDTGDTEDFEDVGDTE